jgi:SSS family solute:Na+ symporter
LGSLLGAVVFVINKTYPTSIIGDIPFMMMAFYLFCSCVVLQVILSYVFPVQHTESSAVLFWKSPLEPLTAKGWSGFGNYKFQSVLLLLVMTVLYSIFK